MGVLDWKRGKFGILVFLCQVAFIIIFGCLADYGWDATPASLRPVQLSEHHKPETEMLTGRRINSTTSDTDYTVPKASIEANYAMFEDIHVMIFIGFGFLMTFLHRYGNGAVGFTFLIASFVLQWGSILRGFYRLSENNYRIRLDLISLVSADFTAATVLITLGVVLGKLSPIQYIVMLMMETVLITLNEWIAYDLFFIKDAGGTITIHLFGAFFGLALARTIHRREWSHPDFNGLKAGSRSSDLFSLIGTLFLWMFWPSFNACIAVDDGRYRAIYNTYFSIAASCLGAYMTSSLVKHDKFSMEVVQNATLAGGVVVGSICDMYLYPYGALICGFCIGIISALGFFYLSPILDKKLGFHDTCGVNNLHAIPSFVGSLLSAIVAGCASKAVYGSGYYTQFPAHVPPANTHDYRMLQISMPDIKPGLGWTPSVQAGYQLAAMAVTLAIAIGGGIITGLVLRIPIWDAPTMMEVYSDKPYFELPEKLTVEDEMSIRKKIDSELTKGSASRNSTGAVRNEMKEIENGKHVH